MIPADLERQISLAEAEVSGVGPLCPCCGWLSGLPLQGTLCASPHLHACIAMG